jgi:hypothetical protein
VRCVVLLVRAHLVLRHDTALVGKKPVEITLTGRHALDSAS